MSQQEILDLIRQRPGIEQKEITRRFGENQITWKLNRLREKGDIVRVPKDGGSSFTWLLYPVYPPEAR